MQNRSLKIGLISRVGKGFFVHVTFIPIMDEDGDLFEVIGVVERSY